MRQPPHHPAARPFDGPALTPRDAFELRRWRDAQAPGAYFGEPAWDMLLQLAMQEEGTALAAAELGATVIEPEERRLLTIERLVHDGLITAVAGADGTAAGYALSAAGRAFMATVFRPGEARAA